MAPVIPINKKGCDAPEDFAKDFKEGSVDDAVLIWHKEGQTAYLPLTDTPFSLLGWLCLKVVHDMLHQEMEEDE